MLQFDLGGAVHSLTFRGHSFYTSNYVASAYEWTLAAYDIEALTPALRKEVVLPAELYPGSMKAAPDNSYLFIIDPNNDTIGQFDAASLEYVRTFDGFGAYLEDIEFSPDSQSLFALVTGTVPIATQFDVTSGLPLRTLTSHANNRVWAALLLPRGKAATITYHEIEFYRQTDHVALMPLAFGNHCETGPIQDDFSTVNYGWPQFDNGDVVGRIVDGQYSIVQRGADNWTAITRGDRWVNADKINVTAQLVAGDGIAGLVFGLNDDWSRFYTLEIAPKYRAVLVRRFVAGEGWETLTFYQSVGGIQTSANPNRLRIEYWEWLDRVLLIVNETGIYVEEPMPANVFTGRIGLIGASFEPGTEIRYDDYLFVGENCDVPFHPPEARSGQPTALLPPPPTGELETITLPMHLPFDH